MQVAIQVVWWIGLIGALILTLVILKEVALLLRVLKDIHELAKLTHEAAQGIATNVAVISRMEGLAEPARGVREATAALATTAASLEQQLAALVAPTSPRGG